MPQVRDAKGRYTRLADGLANLVSGAGTSVDKRTHAFYIRPYILPEQIEAAYRSSWFVRKGIDLPPFDMTRGKRDWQADEDSVDAITKEEKRLQLWTKLRQALTLGRLGGGLIVMGVGNEDASTPLGETTRGSGSLRYLHVMNRWQVSLGPVVKDPADDLFGQPSYFMLTFGRVGGGQIKVHPSRVIPFRGKLAPNLRGNVGDEWYWGDSLLATVGDAVKNADAAMNGFASLIEEAKLDTVTIPNLTQTLATAEGESLIIRRVTVANQLKSTHNTRILDGGRGKDSPGETWETRQVTWAGMPDMIRTLAAAVAGAFDIPATRFLGKSPDGMNATGTGDEANYIAKIRADQEAELRPALDRIDALLLPSAGVTVTAETNYDFPPLQEMSELDKATLFKTNVEAIVALQGTGLIPDLALSKAVQHTAVESGWLDGLDGALAEMPEEERFPSDVAGNGDEDPSAVQGGGDPASGGGTGSEPVRRAANDAAPRPLCVSRKVINVAEIAAWAKEQGLPALNDDLHVTVAFSRQPVDWIAMGADYRDADGKGGFTIGAGGPRLVEPLGDQTAVLLFASSDLAYRHMSMRENGASWDFPEYQPHVSLTDHPCDLTSVEPYRGKIVLGPEVFEDLDTSA